MKAHEMDGEAATARQSMGAVEAPTRPSAATSRRAVDRARDALERIEPRIPVDASTTPGDADALFRITRAGSYYLTADIVGVEGKSGLDIAASGVTLDLKGFAVSGVVGSVDGIRVSLEATTDVVVHDGTVRGWGRNGVDLSLATDIRCRDLVASGNRLMGLVCGARAIIVECATHVNGDYGIQVGDGSAIRQSTAQSNGIFGILAGAGANIEGCIARENGFYGILAGAGSTVRGCTACSNGNVGVGAGEGSVVVDCTASFNNDVGILPGTSGTLTGSTAAGNGGDGIRPGDGVTISGCTARDNGGSGIQISSNSRIVDNVCDGNGAAGMRVLRSGNRIESNSVTDNARGLEIRAGSNIVHGNMVRGNEDNYDIVPGNQLEILLSEIPETIDWPATVVLAGSLTGVAGSNGITVSSSDVTIDLAGHALIGVPGSLDGIEVTQAPQLGARTGLCVRDGVVRDWGGRGIDARYAENGLYRDLRLSSNGDSTLEAGLDCGSNSVVSGCTSMKNGGSGIVANGAITNCSTSENGGHGISGIGTISACTATANERSGFEVGYGTTIRQCVARSNTGDGIVLSSHCRVMENHCSNNGGAGIRASNARQFNHIEANTVTENIVGIVVDSQLNLIVRNAAAHNGDLDPVTGGIIVNYDIVPGNSFVPVPFRMEEDKDTHPYANLSF